MSDDKIILSKWCYLLRGICKATDDGNTNCYENTDIVMNFLIYGSNVKEDDIILTDLERFERLRECIISRRNTDKFNTYRIDLRIQDRSNTFNHSFSIAQYNNYLTICDAWEGIHYFDCREIIDMNKFLQWFDRLLADLRTIKNELKQPFLHKYFGQKSWNGELGYKDHMDRMKESGEWVQGWPKSSVDRQLNNPRIHINIRNLEIRQQIKP